MHRVCVLTVWIGTIWLCSKPGLAAEETSQSSASVKSEDVNWLAGHWESEENGILTEEHWLSARGGILVGVNRSVAGNGKTTFEFMRIAETKDGLTFFASPSGREATPFVLKSASEKQVTFENASNDFPQRIIYRRDGNELKARIEGTIGGREESLEWTWQRKP